jgi:putative ATP-binding cassette transporter
MSVVYAWTYQVVSVLPGPLVEAVVKGDNASFVNKVIIMCLAVALGALSNAAIVAVGEYLCLNHVRGLITRSLTAAYITDRVYYKLAFLDSRITDPDSRITRDVESFCDSLKLLFFGTPMYTGYFATTTSLVAFTYTLVTTANGGWGLVFLTLGMFLLSVLLAWLLSRLSAVARTSLGQSSARFQSLHSHFFTHTEHIAFLDGHEQEQRKLDDSLSSVLSDSKRVALRTLPLNCSTFGFYWGNSVLCYALPGLLYFSSPTEVTGEALSSMLVSDATVLYAFMSSLSMYLLLSQVTSTLMAATARVGELCEVLESVRENPSYRSKVHFKHSNDGSLVVQAMTVSRPGMASPLVQNLQLSVSSANSVLVMGPSGVGKSSLLRVICGLWPAPCGNVTLPAAVGANGLLFVPQKPYMCHGTLVEQLTYPADGIVLPMHVVQSLLDEVGLGYLLQDHDMDDVCDWGQILSLGEQQRLGVARVLYVRPAVAVMDESTSAIDEENEQRVFLALKKRGIGLLSVAHRSSVLEYHNEVISLSRGGTWAKRSAHEQALEYYKSHMPK